MSRQPFLMFTVNEQRYALAIDDVVEVAPMVELMHIPADKPEFIGVANRHGFPLPMLDLRQVFNKEATKITSSTLFVVGQTKSNALVGLLVDEIHQVEYVADEQFEATSGAIKFIRGIISSNNILTQVITLETLVMVYLSDTAVDEIFKV